MKKYIGWFLLLIVIVGMAQVIIDQHREIVRLQTFELNDPDDQCDDEDTPAGIQNSLVCTENFQIVEQ